MKRLSLAGVHEQTVIPIHALLTADRDSCVSAPRTGAPFLLDALSGPGFQQHFRPDPGLHISPSHDVGLRVADQQPLASARDQSGLATTGSSSGLGGAWWRLQPTPGVTNLTRLGVLYWGLI